jgi:hypothetical protein
MTVAQAQTQDVQPKRTELGTYSRDLPRGAAAPSTDAKPPLDARAALRAVKNS